jgi:hypothetical protein
METNRLDITKQLPSKRLTPMNQQTAAAESLPLPTLALCLIVQWTWGIFQNTLGFLMFLAFLPKRHFRFRTSIVTPWKIPYSVGCGMFVFLSSEEQDLNSPKALPKWQYDTLVHEYGHSIQSMILGPLFLPVIAAPSVIWASIPYFQKLRNRKRISYYWLYCEKWANILGDKICQNKRL